MLSRKYQWITAAACLAAITSLIIVHKAPRKMPVHTSAAITSGDIAIFNVLLSTQTDKTGRPIVITREIAQGLDYRDILDNNTSTFNIRQMLHGGKIDAKSWIISDLCIRNAHISVLPDFKGPYPLIFAHYNDLNRLFQHGFWQQFYKRYPHTQGLVSFSLPGYSLDRSYAIVYFEYTYAGTDGSGSLFLLRKVGHGWQVERTVGGWVS
jgi:hypothetical protein